MSMYVVQECITTTKKDTSYSKMCWSIGDKMKTRITGVRKTDFCNV